MSAPDTLAARDGQPAFTEPWQVQVLALVEVMTRTGRFTPSDWAEALGAELAAADAASAPDTTETYFEAAVVALEKLTLQHSPLAADDLTSRKAAWTAAYLRTPHGAPVEL